MIRMTHPLSADLRKTALKPANGFPDKGGLVGGKTHGVVPPLLGDHAFRPFGLLIKRLSVADGYNGVRIPMENKEMMKGG